MFNWLSRLISTKKELDAEYYIVSDGVRIAQLHTPVMEDKFWVSFNIEPLTDPVVPSIADDDFWLFGSWEIFEAKTDRPLGYAIASSAGIDRQKGRITLRGLWSDTQ